MSDRTCSVEGCEKPYNAKGFCSMHYQRFNLRGGDPAVKLKSGRKPGTAGGADNGRWNGGKSTHELHDIYYDMLGRCNRESHPAFDRYGGRGIRVCDEWREDFWAFVRDVGERPGGRTPGGRAYYSLDRVDNDGNYEPGNVRWATPHEQATNKRGYGDFEGRRDAVTGRFQ